MKQAAPGRAPQEQARPADLPRSRSVGKTDPGRVNGLLKKKLAGWSRLQPSAHPNHDGPVGGQLRAVDVLVHG